MHPLPPSADETRRLNALRQYAVLDSPPERAMDDLAKLAASICAAPIALISLIDERRQWFKARIGLETLETPREESFCVHALHQTGLLIVPDATLDARFAGIPIVTGEQGIRFYAGAPLATPDGAVLGTLCVLDRVPRTLTAAQEQALQVLGRQVMTQFELLRRGRELQASEGKLRAIFEAEPECVKLLSPDATPHEINAAGLRLLEADNFEQIAGRSLLPLVVPSDRDAVIATLEAVAQGQRRTIQFRIVGLKGTARWVEMSGAPFRDEATGSTFVLGVSHDITARKLGEDKIQRLNRLYAVSSSINEAIVRIRDPQELYQQACRVAVQRGELVMAWVGLSESTGERLRPAARWGRDEGYLDSIRIFTTPDQPEGQGPGGLAFRTGEPACCNDIEADTGSFASRAEALERGYRSCAAFPLKLAGRSVGILAVYSAQTGYFDTEELRVLNALAENLSFALESHHQDEKRLRAEARFRRLVDSNAQGVMFWNTKGEITGANDAFLDIVGFSREELAAGRVDLVSITPPEFTELDRRAFAEIALSGVCAPFEKEYVRRDGSRVPVLSGAAAFADNPQEGVCFVIDLTERKKLEQQFLRAQRMESIGTLAGGIAHDLNNALGPIVLAIDLLKNKFPNHAGRELLAILDASAQRAADMVRQVLSFARGVEGRKMEVPIKSLLEEVEKMANETFLKVVHLQTLLPQDLWSVRGDPTQLYQVLLNLCVNARDAMPEGGSLTLAADNIELDAHCTKLIAEARPGRYVLLNVEDTGTGMPPDVLEKMFDPFFTTKAVGKGTGLGLSTALSIVRSHGGFIQVDSEVGKGTKFKIYLPAHAQTPPRSVGQIASELPHGNGELILVVDDEAPVRAVTQHTLEAFGYHVILAANGVEAVAIYAARGAEIAVVITDMNMPEMDGATTIRDLQRINPAARIIGVSGLIATSLRTHAAGLGVNQFLAKPYAAGTLLKALRQILAEAP